MPSLLFAFQYWRSIMIIPTLQTLHLFLRPWKQEDAEILFEILQEKDLMRYFPSKSPPSREYVDHYILHQLAHWDKFSYGHWAVIDQQDGLLVGWNGLEFLPETKETEIAYLLSKRVHGRGFATEAARAAVNYGFKTAGLKEIIGLVHEENIGSIRVLEKCGLIYSDRITLWGMEMSRYRLSLNDFLQSGKGNIKSN
jgi:[ribosomal protein S5]-alanine N-acetyltransferase